MIFVQNSFQLAHTVVLKIADADVEPCCLSQNEKDLCSDPKILPLSLVADHHPIGDAPVKHDEVVSLVEPPLLLILSIDVRDFHHQPTYKGDYITISK